MSSTARPTLNFWVNAAPPPESASRDRRRNQQRDRGQEEQARLHAGADPVVFLHVMLESAEQKRRAQHEQRVGDNRAGDGRLHQHVLPGAQGGERDDQFGQVSQRGVEQAADRIARLGRHRFGGVTQQRRQRHDGQDGQHEKQRVRFGLELCGCEHHGHEGQQPEQRVVTDFLEEWFHLGSGGSGSSGSSIIRRSAIIRPTTVKKNPVDQPHIKIPVKASTPPTSRHFSGKTRSPYPTVV